MQTISLNININSTDQITELTSKEQEMFRIAFKNLPNAYAPNSNFLVSSVILLSNGALVLIRP